MASRFWVGGTGNWDAATTTNWAATSGGLGGASVPTSSDDVTFDSLSNATAYTVTITATTNCANISFSNPLVGALTFAGSSALNVFGNFTILSVIIRSYIGALTFSATSIGKILTFNSITFASVTVFNGVGGEWTLQDAFNNGTSSITLTAGTLNTNGKTVTCGAFSATSASLRTLTLGASIINCASWVTNSANITLNANTSTFALSGSGSGGIFQGAGLNYNIVTITNTTTSAISIAGANTYVDLTLTGATNKTQSFAFGSDQIITGTLTINGNSAINRLLVSSNIIGTARTLSATTIITGNVDWMDITAGGTANWNLTTQATNSSGDCGGNSGITFTTADTETWNNANGGSWSGANWTGVVTSRVPLPQDTVSMSVAFGTSKTITADMPRLGGSIDWTGATWTTALTWTLSTATSIFGSLLMINNLTLGSATQLLTFSGRGSFTFTSNALTFEKPITLNAPTGTLTLGGNLTLGVTRVLSITNGTFTVSGSNYVISTGLLTLNGGTLILGTETDLITGTGTTAWNVTSGALNANTSTIKINDTSNTAISFVGGGKTYNNVYFSRGISTASNTIADSNTFADFKDDGSVAHSLIFTAGTTQTVTTFTVSGNASNLITINSTTTATHALIKSGDGTINRNYLNIQHSVATPAATWFAGSSSTNNQATATAGSGWEFSDTGMSVNDSVTVSESVVVIKILAFSVNDSVTVTEGLSVAKVYAITLFDSVTVSEATQQTGNQIVSEVRAVGEQKLMRAGSG